MIAVFPMYTMSFKYICLKLISSLQLFRCVTPPQTHISEKKKNLNVAIINNLQVSSRCILAVWALRGPDYFLERSHSHLSICITEIQAASRFLLLALVFPAKSHLGRELEQAGHCNLVMEGTGACSLFTQAVQPAAKHKKRQQTLPGKLISRAEELFHCKNGRFFSAVIFSTLLMNSCCCPF